MEYDNAIFEALNNEKCIFELCQRANMKRLLAIQDEGHSFEGQYPAINSWFAASDVLTIRLSVSRWRDTEAMCTVSWSEPFACTQDATVLSRWLTFMLSTSAEMEHVAWTLNSVNNADGTPIDQAREIGLYRTFFYPLASNQQVDFNTIVRVFGWHISKIVLAAQAVFDILSLDIEGVSVAQFLLSSIRQRQEELACIGWPGKEQNEQMLSAVKIDFQQQDQLLSASDSFFGHIEDPEVKADTLAFTIPHSFFHDERPAFYPPGINESLITKTFSASYDDLVVDKYSINQSFNGTLYDIYCGLNKIAEENGYAWRSRFRSFQSDSYECSFHSFCLEFENLISNEWSRYFLLLYGSKYKPYIEVIKHPSGKEPMSREKQWIQSVQTSVKTLIKKAPYHGQEIIVACY